MISFLSLFYIPDEYRANCHNQSSKVSNVFVGKFGLLVWVAWLAYLPWLAWLAWLVGLARLAWLAWMASWV